MRPLRGLNTPVHAPACLCASMRAVARVSERRASWRARVYLIRSKWELIVYQASEWFTK